jgi:hypothetical protein
LGKQEGCALQLGQVPSRRSVFHPLLTPVNLKERLPQPQVEQISICPLGVCPLGVGGTWRRKKFSITNTCRCVPRGLGLSQILCGGTRHGTALRIQTLLKRGTVFPDRE